MIAHLPDGHVGTKLSSSDSALRGFHLPSPKALSNPNAMNFDGGVGLSLARRKTLPVFLFPVFREFGAALQPAAEALYRLQQASLEFRVVAATDMPVFKSIRPFGWGISHIRDERTWNSTQQSWSEYLFTELKQVSKDFGCSYVVGMTEQGITDPSWAELVSVSGMSGSLRNPTVGDSSSNSHYSWRGWLHCLPSGRSSHTVKNAGLEWTVEIDKSPDSSMVFVGSPSSEDEKIAQSAGERGWSSVTLVSNSSSPQSRDVRQAVEALLDGLSLDGAGVVSTDKLTFLDRADCSATVFVEQPSLHHLEMAELKALAHWSSPVS